MLYFVIPGPPIEKPNIRSPKWKIWRRWADTAFLAALAAGMRHDTPTPELLWVMAWFPIPPSLSTAEAQRRAGQPHRSKPDGNHCWNSLGDGLFKRDELIADQRCLKLWDDGRDARVEVYMGALSELETVVDMWTASALGSRL